MVKVRIGVLVVTDIDDVFVKQKTLHQAVMNIMAYVRENVEANMPDGDAVMVYAIEIDGNRVDGKILEECNNG